MDSMTHTDLKFNAQVLAQRLRELLQPYQPAKRWLVGFSGGLDSTVLLAALLATKPQQPVIAIHVNHGLSPKADEWQRHCQALCHEWQVDCRVEQVQVHGSGYGLEDAARNVRYRAFQTHMEEGDILLLGHHRDDQAETLLFRLMRGAGPRGLGSIVAQRPFAGGRMVRPLLTFSKAELESYANSAGLHWISDDSNSDETFDRNFLRQQVLPVLARRWPTFTERWRLTAEACQEADQLSRDLGRIDLECCGGIIERGGWSVDWQCLIRLPPYRRNNLLRTWAIQHHFPVMERKHLQEINKQFFTGPPTSQAAVCWANVALRFYRKRLYLIHNPKPPQKQQQNVQPLAWSLDRKLTLAGGSRLSAHPKTGGLRVPAGQAEVRWRQGGERCQPTERQHSQSLKKLFQEYHLEPWLRDNVPLIYVNEQLAAVGDLWVCKGFTAEEDEPGYQLEWRVLGAG
jgi:tRNA(Ile)-lysidine synthase